MGIHIYQSGFWEKRMIDDVIRCQRMCQTGTLQAALDFCLCSLIFLRNFRLFFRDHLHTPRRYYSGWGETQVIVAHN